MRESTDGDEASNFYVFLFLELLVIFNSIFYLLYLFANPPGIMSATTFWSYLTTEVSKLINVSLLFPLVIFVIEDKLKIASNIRQTRRDRREKDIEEHKKRQWDCIEKTFLIWNEIHDLASEVRYYENKPNGKSLGDYFKEFKILNNKAEELVPFWKFNFENLSMPINQKDISKENKDQEKRNISEEDRGSIQIAPTDHMLQNLSFEVPLRMPPDTEFETSQKPQHEETEKVGKMPPTQDRNKNGCLSPINLFIVFFNILIDSAVSVAYILNNSSDPEKEDIKEALGGIQKGLESSCRYPMIDILYFSSKLSTNKFKKSEMNEDDKNDDLKIQKDIERKFNQLNFWADRIVRLQEKYTVMSYLEGDDAEIFRNNVKEFKTILKNESVKKVELVKLEEYYLIDSFKKLPIKKFQLATEVVYSKEFLFDLADILSINFFAESIDSDQRLLNAQDRCGYKQNLD